MSWCHQRLRSRRVRFDFIRTRTRTSRVDSRFLHCLSAASANSGHTAMRRGETLLYCIPGIPTKQNNNDPHLFECTRKKELHSPLYIPVAGDIRLKHCLFLKSHSYHLCTKHVSRHDRSKKGKKAYILDLLMLFLRDAHSLGFGRGLHHSLGHGIRSWWASRSWRESGWQVRRGGRGCRWATVVATLTKGVQELLWV